MTHTSKINEQDHGLYRDGEWDDFPFPLKEDFEHLDLEKSLKRLLDCKKQVISRFETDHEDWGSLTTYFDAQISLAYDSFEQYYKILISFLLNDIKNLDVFTFLCIDVDWALTPPECNKPQLAVLTHILKLGSLMKISHEIRKRPVNHIFRSSPIRGTISPSNQLEGGDRWQRESFRTQGVAGGIGWSM